MNQKELWKCHQQYIPHELSLLLVHSVLSLHLEKGSLVPGLENFCQNLDLYGHYAENLEQANKTLKVNIYFSLYIVILFSFCETATSFHLSSVSGVISALPFSGLMKFRLPSTIKWWKLLYLFRASNFWCFFQVFVYVCAYGEHCFLKQSSVFTPTPS